MCFDTGSVKWKREQIVDHKFDFIDVNDFTSESCWTQFKYLFVFLVIIKSVLVYTADLWTAILLLANPGWSSEITKPKVPLVVAKWVFVASIAVSFILLAWEWRKTYRVVKSRDIAYSYTLPGAYRFYSVRSYPHFCLYEQIGDTKAGKDSIAFFCFFVLKGWKRFLFAEAPRQCINALTLAGVYFPDGKFTPSNFYAASDIWMERVTVILMTFTFIIWILTAIRLVVAFLAYIPLLFSIRGNLKEYVCHKIDKKIAHLLKLKSRKRILEEQAERKRLERELAMRAPHMLQNVGQAGVAPNIIKAPSGKPILVQPTLPDIGRVDDPESIPLAQGAYQVRTGAPTVISVGGSSNGEYPYPAARSEVSAFPTSAFSGHAVYPPHSSLSGVGPPQYYPNSATSPAYPLMHAHTTGTAVTGMQHVPVEAAASRLGHYPSYPLQPHHPYGHFVYRPGGFDTDKPMPPVPSGSQYSPFQLPPGPPPPISNSQPYRDSSTTITGPGDMVDAVPAVLNPSASTPIPVPGQGQVPLTANTSTVRGRLPSSDEVTTGEERYTSNGGVARQRPRANADAITVGQSGRRVNPAASQGPGPPPPTVNF